MEYAIFDNVTYESALKFIKEMKHEDIQTLRLNVAEYNAIVKLYTHLLSATRNFEYEFRDNSNLTIALTVKDAMTTQSALYNSLRNGNLHLRVFRAIEDIAREMSSSRIEFHK